MDHLEQSRHAWERAQADLQTALAELERRVASDTPEPDSIQGTREVVAKRQSAADEYLNRYITQVGKTQP
jgi:hypothetical protein